MPRYAFHAADAQGVVNRGQVEAAHEGDVYASLRQRGLSLIECREKNPPGGFLSRRVPLPEQVLFCRHLLALVKAGVPVHLALKDVTGLSANRATRHALHQAYGAVMGGASLSSAFEVQAGKFDPLFELLLRAGEKTGKLPQALSYLHESLSWKEGYSTRLKRMLVYPALQITLAAIATLVLMLVAVPEIIQLFGFLGKELPWYSSALLLSVKIVGFALAAALAGGIVFLAFLPLLRAASESAAIAIDGFLLRLPGLGKTLVKLALAQLAQLFAALLESGVGMNEALQILPQLTTNRALAAELEKVRGYVAGGQGFALAFERAMHLPSYMVRLLKVGEDGGELAPSLRHIAQLYQEESGQALEAILKGTGLFVTAMVGFVLAAVVLGVVYPLYQGLGAVMGAG